MAKLLHSALARRVLFTMSVDTHLTISLLPSIDANILSKRLYKNANPVLNFE